MLKTRIIPCLDVKDGRVVKGINFLDLIDAGDPVEQAKVYSEVGADEICFLDISASIEKRKTMINIVAKTAEHVFIPLTVGGGINEIEDIRALLKSGADKVSINTAAILNENLIKDSSQRFGSQCIVAAVDAKRHYNDWIVYSHGGTKNTGIKVFSWLEKLQHLGAGEILLTSMDRDGTKNGFDLELLKKSTDLLGIPVIASGGVGNLKHFEEGVTKGGASALLAASVFHFADFSIKEVKKFLDDKKIPVRINYRKEAVYFFQELFNTIQKKAKSKEKKSYTKALLKSGKNKIAQKVSEESSELIIDYLNGSKKRTIEEASDLIYHLFVLLHSKNIKLEDIKKELKSRHNVRRK